VGAACESGAVHVRIEVPEKAALSPLMSGPARLTLIAEADGQPAQSATRDLPAPGAAATSTVSFGEIAVGTGVRVSLLAETAAGRLVGFGRASTPLAVTTGDAPDVPIRLRRPYAYVAGGASLAVFDTTVEPGAAFAAELDAVAQPHAVATTPDGAEIVVVAGDMLRVLSTGTHESSAAAQTAIAAGVTELAISPDSRWAVALHAAAGSPTGVSIVDLEALRRGPQAAAFAAVERPGAVAVTAEAAYVLVDASRPGPPPDFAEDCTQVSRILPVPLATPATPRPFINVAGAARDVTASERGDALFVAQTCQNRVTRVATDGGSQLRVLTVPSPTVVAAAGARVWAVGATSGAAGVRLVLATATVDGAQESRLDFPTTQELAQTNDLAEGGQIAEVRLDADRLEALGLSVVPDARHVALLVHGSYHGDEVVRPIPVGGEIVDQVILPRLDLDTYEYQLVDVTTGVAAQRLRTSCAIDWERGVAFLDDWSCAALPGQETAEDEFVARQVAVLYGGQ
jgi:hypothetical protein